MAEGPAPLDITIPNRSQTPAVVNGDKPATEKAEFVLTNDQQEIINKLIRLQHEGNLTDKQFGENLLDMSESKWNRIRQGKYWKLVKRPELELLDLQRKLNSLTAKKELSEQFENKTFFPFAPFKAIFAGVEECREKPLAKRERIIFYLAPTYGGKSFLGFQLVQKYQATLVRARQGWLRSRYIALKSICEAYGIETGSITSADRLEEKLIKFFKGLTAPVLVIDEGEYFGPQILDSLKAFINETRIVIVIMSIPKAYDKWNAKHDESGHSGQIMTRTHLVVELKAQDFSKDIVAEFYRGLPLAEFDICCESLSRQAARFGALGLINRVGEDLRALNLDRIPTPIHQKVIDTVLVSMGYNRVNRGNRS